MGAIQHAWHGRAELGKERINAIIELNAIKAELKGLLGLTALSFLEAKAKERPDLVAATLGFAEAVGQLDRQLAQAAVVHCLKLNHLNLNKDWHRKWLAVAKKNEFLT